MNLTINRYFQHKFYKNNIIKTSMRSNGDGNGHHLYISLIDGDEIKGMGSKETFMLATSIRGEVWNTILEDWTKQNSYISFNPYRMTSADSMSFMKKCYETKKTGSRLGQAMLFHLDDKTPTPNADIFHTTDEVKVSAWFFENHVEGSQ
jgi:hypothetical protein